MDTKQIQVSLEGTSALHPFQSAPPPLGYRMKIALVGLMDSLQLQNG